MNLSLVHTYDMSGVKDWTKKKKTTIFTTLFYTYIELFIKKLQPIRGFLYFQNSITGLGKESKLL